MKHHPRPEDLVQAALTCDPSIRRLQAETEVAEADRKRGPEHGYWMDGLDGYAAARSRLLDALAEHKSRGGNALVASGYVLAFFRGRHVCEVTELSEEEAADSGVSCCRSPVPQHAT